MTDSRKSQEFCSRFGAFNDPENLEQQLRMIIKSESSGNSLMCVLLICS